VRDVFDRPEVPFYNLARLDRRCAMTRVWQLQEAKNKFSEVVDDALKKGPQVVTRRGKEAVVILSSTDYRKMLVQQKKLSQFFGESPLAGVNLDLTRDKSDTRKDATL